MNIDHCIESSRRHLVRELDEIPASLVSAAAGIAFFTIVQGAFLVSGSLSSGIFVKRLGKKKWSAPISIALGGVGIGLQAGLQKVDNIVIFTDESDIRSFSSRGQLKLSTAMGLAAGPVGRNFDVGALLSRRGAGVAFSYSRAQGLFGGMSLEGSILLSNAFYNSSFYGAKHDIGSILEGGVEPPPGPKRDLVASFHAALNAFAEGRLETRVVASSSASAEGNTKTKTWNTGGGKYFAAKPVPPGVGEKDDEGRVDEADLLGMADYGKEVLQTAFSWSGNDLTKKSTVRRVEFVADHLLDEAAPQARAWGIISVRGGTTAELVRGDLGRGLPDGLEDYVEVRLASGKQGLVSRFVLSEYVP